MQLSFGSGEVFARLIRDAAGNTLTSSTPIRVAGLQEMSLDFSGDLKEFHGQNRYALAIAMGKVKTNGKMKGALLNGRALNSLYFGGTLAGGTMKSIYADVVGVVAAASLTTVAATDTGVVGAAFVDDLGVIGSNGIAFTRVASAPAVGQYSVTGAGVYTFNATDAGTRVYRSYTYTYTSTDAKKISLDNIAMGIGSHVVNNPAVYIPLIVAAAARWDGITCNLEAVPVEDRAAATSFYAQLATALHAAGKLLHATVPATTGTAYDADWWVGWCDHLALAKVCDGIKVMSYTETGPGSDPGPAAPQAFWDQVYAYIRRVVPEPYWPRVFCGCRAFGHMWTAGDTVNAEYQTYHQAIAGALTYGKQIEVRDTEMGWGNGTYTTWCGTPATLDRSQLEAARSGFGGIGLWKLDDGDLEEFFPTTKQIGTDNMAAFVEQRFPVEYAWGAEGGPKYRTQVVTSDGGAEARVQTWQYPLCSYKLTRDLFSPADHEKLLAFWRIMGGRATGFRFKDFMDFRATGQNIGTGDGLTATFQLRKAYTFSDGLTGVSQTLWRAIKKPVPGTVSIYAGGVLKTSGWTVNTSTGLVSFTAAPASGVIITATYEFDVPVRFANDDLRVVVDKNFNTYSWSGVGFEEVRV